MFKVNDKVQETVWAGQFAKGAILTVVGLGTMEHDGVIYDTIEVTDGKGRPLWGEADEFKKVN